MFLGIMGAEKLHSRGRVKQLEYETTFLKHKESEEKENAILKAEACKLFRDTNGEGRKNPKTCS